jgi:CRP-like cAMP-binding protein
MDARAAVSTMRLFRGAAAADIDALASIAEPRTYAVGDCIFDAQHPATALYAIAIGTIDITLGGKDIAVATLGSGQSIGDLAFFHRGTYGGSARTRETTSVVCLPFAGLDRLLSERPGLALVFYRNAAELFAHHLSHLAAERDRPYL